MRVAFLNRPRTYPGGDMIAMDATIHALQELGVYARFVSAPGFVKDFDLVHMFHCNFDWSWQNYQAIKAAGKSYVLTPIFYPDLLSGITREELKEIINSAAYLTPFSFAEFKEI